MFGEYLSFDAMTFRKNNNNITLKNKPVILAVGDSYTVGVEVDNADTWPSQLEFKSRIRVLNGGVGGYGLDQMLTRTGSLLKNMTVDYVIVAFSEEDIRRVRQKKQYSIMKPLYKIENNKLLSSRVKMADYPPPDYFKKIFGYSYVVHLFMSKLFKEYWSKGGLQDMEYEDINEIEISCKIIDGFVEIAEAQKVKYVIFVLLPKHYNDCSLVNHPVAKYIKNISKKNKRIFLIDLQTELLNMKIFNQEKNPEIRAFFNDYARGYHGHFSKEGNEFVAQTIHSFLRSEKAYGSIP